MKQNKAFNVAIVSQLLYFPYILVINFLTTQDYHVFNKMLQCKPTGAGACNCMKEKKV